MVYLYVFQAEWRRAAESLRQPVGREEVQRAFQQGSIQFSLFRLLALILCKILSTSIL